MLSLIQDVLQLMSNQVLTLRCIWRIVRWPEYHVLAERVCMCLEDLG
jgi:hypothetical protein